ncbi:hypothetical protein ACFVX6_36600 [Streptomyces sp. NPDC058289]|uniref:hypothetical protein n=1 Tax=Streptomyces sp. NPDC058289 TaxID=3346425 RepID=UPI0036EA5383
MRNTAVRSLSTGAAADSPPPDRAEAEAEPAEAASGGSASKTSVRAPGAPGAAGVASDGSSSAVATHAATASRSGSRSADPSSESLGRNNDALGSRPSDDSAVPDVPSSTDLSGDSPATSSSSIAFTSGCPNV